MDERKAVPKRQMLGEILLGRNMITSKQLDEALQIQKKDRKHLGETLIDLGYVEDHQIVVALVLQCNLPYIAIDKYEIDRSILSLVPEEAARRLRAIPLDRVGDVLSVVMENPLDVGIKAELQRLTKCQIASFIATRLEIERAIEASYTKKETKE